MFRNNFFHKNTVVETGAPSLLQKEKRRSAKSNVLKVLYPDIGKNTNLVSKAKELWKIKKLPIMTYSRDDVIFVYLLL